MKSTKRNYQIVFIFLCVLFDFYVFQDTFRFFTMVAVIFLLMTINPIGYFIYINRKYGKLQSIANDITNEADYYYGTPAAFFHYFKHNRSRLKEIVIGHYAILLNGVYICKTLTADEILNSKGIAKIRLHDDDIRPRIGYVTNHGRLIKSLSNIK